MATRPLHQFRSESTRRRVPESSSRTCWCCCAHSVPGLRGAQSLSAGDEKRHFRETRASSNASAHRSSILGTGRALPSRVMRNEDLTDGDPVASEYIERLTGIRERRVLEAGLATSDLAAAAGHAA